MKKNNSIETMDLIPAVAYARFSSSNQNEASIEQQLRDIHRFAEQNGYLILKEYTDSARSAFKEATESQRPAFREMIDDAKRKQFKAVIIWKTDRFSRNRVDFAIYTEKLNKLGVRLIKVMEGNAEGAQGQLMDGIMSEFAAYYSKNLSENVKRGLEDNARKFKVVGTIPLGYVRDPETGRYAIDPVNADVVRRIFKEYSEGKSAVSIFTELNREGFKTRDGKPFNKNSIRAIIRNERYAGVYFFKGERFPGKIPEIVSHDVWEKAQERLSEHHHTPKVRCESGFLLTGKVFCGECGSAMPGDSGKSKTGRIYYWYSCRNKKFSKSCDNPRANKQNLEDVIVNALIDWMHDENNIDRAVQEVLDFQEEVIKNNTHLRSLEMQLHDSEKRLGNLLKAVEMGVITETTNNRIVELESAIKNLHSEIDKESFCTPSLSADQIRFLFEKMRSADSENERARQRLVNTLLKKVFVYKNGNVVLILNTGKGEKSDSLTLDKINDLFEDGSKEAKSMGISIDTHPDGVLLPRNRASHFAQNRTLALMQSKVLDGYYCMKFLNV